MLTKQKLEELALRKDFQEIVRLAERSNCLKEYQKIKYQAGIYQIGESILINKIKGNDKITQIGKLDRIISIKSVNENNELPLITVNWYCNKEDIQIDENFKKGLSVYELFLTEIKETIFVDSIKSSVNVMSFEDYEKCEDTDGIYFIRGQYNIQNQRLIPEMEEWTRQCVCNQPVNPDLAYIYCEKCEKWMHMECMGVTDEEAKEIEQYICIQCK